MTLILSTVFLTTNLSYVLYKQIQCHRYIVYGLSFILAVIASDDANSITLGYIPLGIMLVVMVSGILKRSTLKKRLFMVRAELAIIASIFAFVHAFSFLEYVLDDIGLFNMSISFYMGVLSMMILIPLFLTSFPFIRKKIGYRKWKMLHLLSYGFYGLLGLHLILIQNERMWLYIILFGFYFIMKSSLIIKKSVEKNHKKNSSSQLNWNFLCITLFFVAFYH